MKRVSICLLLFLSAAFLSSCAPLAQPPPGKFLAWCKAKAEEHGGKITKEEFVAEASNKQQAERVFDACDVKKRGYLTVEELSEPHRQQMIQDIIRLTEPGTSTSAPIISTPGRF